MFTGVTRSRGINRIDKICGLSRIAKNSSTHMINDKWDNRVDSYAR